MINNKGVAFFLEATVYHGILDNVGGPLLWCDTLLPSFCGEKSVKGGIHGLWVC